MSEYDFTGKDMITTPPGYTFTTVDQVPLEMVEEFAKKNREPGQFERSIIKNLEMQDSVIGVCLLYKGIEIAALEWVFFSLKGVRHSEKYPESTDAFYALDAFVAYEHRGKGLHRICFLKRFEVAKQCGKKVGYGIVRANNERALSTNDGIGRRIGRVFKIQSLGKYLNLYKLSRWILYLKKHQ